MLIIYKIFFLSFFIPLLIVAQTKIIFPQLEKHILNNGLELWFLPDEQQPAIFIDLYLKQGTNHETPGKEGLYYLLTQMVLEGSRNYPNATFKSQLRALGAELSFSSDLYQSRLSLAVLKEDIDQGLIFMNEALFEATLAPERFDYLIERAQKDLEKQNQDPSFLMKRLEKRLLFGEKQRAGRYETKTSLKNLNHTDLLTAYQELVKPDGGIILCVGDFNSQELKSKLLKHFSDWQGQVQKLEPQGPMSVDNNGLYIYDKPGLTQATITLQSEGLKRSDPQYPAYRLFNYCLGAGSFSSRLMQEVRVKKGLTYGIYSSMHDTPDYGTLKIKTFTRNNEVLLTLSAIEEVLASFRIHGLSQKELDEAKSYFLGNLPIRYETPLDKGRRLASAPLFGVDRTFIENELTSLYEISLEEVNQFIQTYLKNIKWQKLLIIDEKKESASLKKAGFTLVKIKNLE